tara:strand:- start:288 stop:668 length:381 start_codon:yes stop_codon:yes gene_type:complete
MKTSKPRGLGDKIEKFTEKTGIKKIVDTISEATGIDCGCSEKRDRLNAMFPNFRNIRPFTKDEKAIYEQVMPDVDKTKTVTKQQQYILNGIYKAVFNTDAKFTSCSPCVKRTLDNLRKVYEKSCDL